MERQVRGGEDEVSRQVKVFNAGFVCSSKQGIGCLPTAFF